MRNRNMPVYAVITRILWLHIFDVILMASIEDNTSGCLVPTGSLILIDNKTNKQLKPGSIAPVHTNVVYNCLESYSLEGLVYTLNYCLDTDPVIWATKHPECIKLCPPIKGHTIEANCEYRGQAVSCKGNVKSGTIARISCAVMYVKPKDKLLHETLHCQNDGAWDHLPFECVQVCGTVDNTTQPNLDTSLRKPVDVPWHINIYSTVNSEIYKYICGGTLIQSKIVISAANCFWNDEKSILYDKSKFIVTAGKIHRDYYSDEEAYEVQKVFISKIDIPTTFRGSLNNYEGDIAVLTLRDHIKLKNFIIPMCILWSSGPGKFWLTSPGKLNSEGLDGFIVGLGAVDLESNYPLLRHIRIGGISTNKCRNNEIVGNYSISDDKFCAYSKEQNKSICKGDNGGAFILRDRTQFWFIGVLSNIIMQNTSYYSDCDEKSLATFTDIYPHERFIKNIIDNLSKDELSTNEVNIRSSSSILPGCYIPTSNIILVDTKTKYQLESGTTILSTTSITYSCSGEYVLDGEINNFCNGKSWEKVHPKCIKTCSPIQGNTIRVTYYYNRKIIEHQTFFKPGTIAKIKCATMYKKPRKYQIHEDVHCQTNGVWDYEPFQCEQICGILDTNLPFSVNSTLTQPSKVPWHIALYSRSKYGKYENICGGTIIQSKIIITAAHCFWNPSVAVIEDASKYLVVAGKFYRDYYAENELLPIQQVNISKIDIPRTFYGPSYDWANDIAVLTLTEHIEYKSHVRPACLMWKEQSDQYIQSDLLGVVAGWGVTDTGTYSPELRSVELLSIDNHTCKRKKISKNDDIAPDKFCVETSGGKNVCSGDSGGGFVVPTEINNKIYFNLWGIVSNGIIPRGELIPECNSKFITTFTNVQYYKQMIEDLTVKVYQ